jgi:predicted RNase H-like HicB family nuclease
LKRIHKIHHPGENELYREEAWQWKGIPFSGIFISEEEKTMHVRVVIEHDEATDSYSAVCPELPGCASAGDTEEEAMDNIKEAIELYLEPDKHEVSPGAKVYEVAI